MERRQIGEGEHLLGVGHLRDGFCGDEGNGVDVAEAGGDEGAEVVSLDLAGDGEGEALPGVARALDDFDDVAHAGLMRVSKAAWLGGGEETAGPSLRSG